MSPTRPGHALLLRTILLSAATLVLAACGGSGDSGSTALPAAVEAELDASTAPEPSSPEPAGGSDKTLDDYLGTAALALRGPGAFAGDIDTDRVEQEQQLVQQEIQRCMLEQGFEYVPEQASGGLRVFLRTVDPGSSPEEFAASQGFGITKHPEACNSRNVSTWRAARVETPPINSSMAVGETWHRGFCKH